MRVTDVGRRREKTIEEGEEKRRVMRREKRIGRQVAFENGPFFTDAEPLNVESTLYGGMIGQQGKLSVEMVFLGPRHAEPLNVESTKEMIGNKGRTE